MSPKAQRTPFFTVGGYAHDDGFSLNWHVFNGRRGMVRHVLTNAETGPKWDWPVIVGLLIAWFSSVAFSQPWLTVFIALLYLRSVPNIVLRRFKGWHWVEHQAAFLLERGGADIGEHSPLSLRCGSAKIIAPALTGASLVASFQHPIIGLPFCVSCCALWLLLRAMDGGWPSFRSRYTGALAWTARPAELVTLALQRVLFIREPTAAQTVCARLWAQVTAQSIAADLLSDDRLPVIRYRSGSSI